MILTSLLVGLMMLGNAAAWIHHGTCNDVQCQVQKSEAKSNCGGKHCCHSHRTPPQDNSISLEGSDPVHHDASDCAVCRAATTGGVTASLSITVATACPSLGVLALLLVENEPEAFSHEQYHLRGPPAFSA